MTGTGSAEDLRARVARCMNVLAARGQLAFGLGHVSARDGAGGMYVVGHLHTLDRGAGPIGREHVIRVDASGAVMDGFYEPPGEVHIHAAVLAARPDVGAVVHTHPEAVIAATAAGHEIVALDMRSALFSPRVPVLGFPESLHAGTPERGAAVARALGQAAAVVLEGHGAVAVGATPEDAVVTSLCLERAAAMRLRIGAVQPRVVPPSELRDGVPVGLDADELMRTAWHHVSVEPPGGPETR